MKFQHWMALALSLVTTIGPLFVHLMSPTTVPAVAYYLGPIAAFLIQLSNLFQTPPAFIASTK